MTNRRENGFDFLCFLWYYVSMYSFSKGEAVMAKEDVLIAIDAEAVEAARAEELPEAHLLLLFETFQAVLATWIICSQIRGVTPVQSLSSSSLPS